MLPPTNTQHTTDPNHTYVNPEYLLMFLRLQQRLCVELWGRSLLLNTVCFSPQLKVWKRIQEIQSVLMNLGLQVCAHTETPKTERFPATGLNSLLKLKAELNTKVQFSDKTTKSWTQCTQMPFVHWPEATLCIRNWTQHLNIPIFPVS